MAETIFEAENERYRLTVTVAPEDGVSFADLEPEVKIERVSSEVYYALDDLDTTLHANVRAVLAALDTFPCDVESVTFPDGTEIDVYGRTYRESGSDTDISADLNPDATALCFDRHDYIVASVANVSDYTDIEKFWAHCRALWLGEIGVYYVKATVWEKCGSCATWHHVTDDSIGYVVDTPDTATWHEVAHNALHAAGLPVDTFTF